MPENTIAGGWHHFEAEPRTADAAEQEEQAVLGGMLLSPDAIGQTIPVLQAAHFTKPRHGAIFEAIKDQWVAGLPSDAVAIASELQQRGELERIGGAPYLHTLIAMVPTATNVGYYADLVRERAIKRRTIEAGTRIAQYGELALEGGASDLAALQAAVQSQVDTVFDARTADAGYVSLEEMWPDALSGLDDIQAGRVAPGLPSGFPDLDALTGGWQPGQMIIVAARPGIGKSTLGVDFAREATFRQRKTSVIFSLEMSRTELWQRIISAETKIRPQAMKTPGALGLVEMDRIADTYRELVAGADAQVLVDDNPSTTVETIKAKARMIAKTHDIGLIVVDYLQLLTSGSRVENRQQEVSEFSRKLKLLAKELGTAVVAICQLNRGPETRSDKRPMLSDLRESGSLEQDADIAILLNRPDAYDTDDPRGGEADLIVAKHRGGPTRTIVVAHQLQYCRFVSMASA